MKPESEKWTPENGKLDILLIFAGFVIVSGLVVAVMNLAFTMLHSFQTTNKTTHNCNDVIGYPDGSVVCETNIKEGGKLPGETNNGIKFN